MDNSEDFRAPELPEPSLSSPAGYFGPAHFHWLVKGRLGGVPQPGVIHAIETDLEALQRLEIKLLVTLTEEWQPPVGLLARYGIESLYVPVTDMTPPTIEQADMTCQIVHDHVDRGQAVAFHCHGGRGRTGTLLAAQLIWYQPDADAAVERVKSVTTRWIETDSQLEFLAEYARHRRGELA